MWMLLLALAWAEGPDLTLNGVDISAVRDQRFKSVDVYVDDRGAVHISSDRYKVQGEVSDEAPGAEVERARPADRPTRVAPQPGKESAEAMAQADRERPVGAPPRGSYWLASEDNGTSGHEVTIEINGVAVRTVRSGEPQVIEDISHHLRRGDNEVLIHSNSVDPQGRTFFVYIGPGSNEGGTVTLAKPEIQLGLGPTRRGQHSRPFRLLVE
ncbi:MAG: hypothetical protein EA397_13855 [Deltaproteobacteria bacterium]|nr:MAG: hypothetical protein EA397_13855 [Deltaproteobacteria bacterium]